MKELARQLRNNSTRAEIILWNKLKGKFAGKYDFHRQKPLDNFIADFYCYELRLVIEIDGVTHSREEVRLRDFKKECRFIELGLYVLRFTDSDIFFHLDNSVGVISQFVEAFEKNDFSLFENEDSHLNVLFRLYSGMDL